MYPPDPGDHLPDGTTLFGECCGRRDAYAGTAAIYADLPVQVYDWDGDGANEVYISARPLTPNVLALRRDTREERAKRYEGDATMIVLDALTGGEKHRFPMPAPADDSFLFADLTGRGRSRGTGGEGPLLEHVGRVGGGQGAVAL